MIILLQPCKAQKKKKKLPPIASSSFCSRPVFRQATAAPEKCHNKILNLLPKMSCNDASSSLKTKPQGKNNNNNNKIQKQKQRSSYQIDFYTHYKDSTNQKKSLKNHNKILTPFPNVSLLRMLTP
jgi:hypothetical protein